MKQSEIKFLTLKKSNHQLKTKRHYNFRNKVTSDYFNLSGHHFRNQLNYSVLTKNPKFKKFCNDHQ